jgi:hypothetical protein
MDWEAIKLEASGHIHRALGESVRYHYKEGYTKPLCAIFTMVDVQVSMEGQVPVDSQKPMCNIRRCDIDRKPRQRDTITRRNVTYEIQQVKEDLDASYNCLLLAIDNRAAVQQRDRT